MFCNHYCISRDFYMYANSYVAFILAELPCAILRNYFITLPSFFHRFIRIRFLWNPSPGFTRKWIFLEYNLQSIDLSNATKWRRLNSRRTRPPVSKEWRKLFLEQLKMIRRDVGMNDAYGVSRAFLRNRWGIKKIWRSNLGRNCNSPMEEGHKAKGRTKGRWKNGSRCRTRETINGKTGATKQCAGHI